MGLKPARPPDIPHAIVYAHDGSFPGFLCAAAEAMNARATGAPVPTVRPRLAPAALFEETVEVARDDGRARSLWARMARVAGPEAMRTIFEAFCSDRPGADAAAAVMLARFRHEGAGALDDLGSPEGRAVEKAAVRTRAEAHKLSGLLRFSELADGSWYARFEPSCDVLPFLADHFTARFPETVFAIHDLRRGSAVLHERGAAWRLVAGFELAGGIMPEAPLPDHSLSGREREVRESWRDYFRSVAIRERTNPRLQASHMPKRYWTWLVEMNLYN